MGQCTSRKATGNLATTSTFVSHINAVKMEKPRNFKSNNDEESRKNRATANENTQLLGPRKSQPKHSKGVAMSFGFKRRPTPMTTNNIGRDLENSPTSTNDPNGNKEETTPTFQTRSQTVKDRTMHKISSTQKTSSISSRPSRFGFHQSATDRTNKVADIKTSPIEFGGTFQNANKSRLTSPTTETHVFNDQRTFTRNVARREPVERLTSPTTEQQDMSFDRRTKTFIRSVSKTDTVEKLVSPTMERDVSNNMRTRTLARNVTATDIKERQRVVIDSNDNSAGVKDRLGDAQIQMGKFTFQTTRLPQPEPIRVIETKTAKTIANNNKRSARIRRLHEEASVKVEEDSGFGSNTSGYLGENHPITNSRYTDPTLDDNRIQHCLRRNTLNMMENSDSFSETSTPPPLPELPCVFHTTSPISTKPQKEYGYKDKQDSKKPFIKLGSQRTFLKSKTAGTDSTPHSPSEQDWINAGEAMAEDTVLLVSPMHKIYENKDTIQDHYVSTCTTVVEAALQTLVKPSISLELTQNFKTTQKRSLLEEDPNFTAVAANNKIGHLLDEEILSPVESLLSCSETEEILKKKIPHSSSNSKDINEKLTPASPETPSNGTYSLSLSEDKEDFLIDDEIADQPELVFEDGINNGDNMTSFNYKPETIDAIIEHDSIRNQRGKAFEIEASPLTSRKRRDFLRSMTGSIESLSPCESIASDDLMMEFDISQSIEVDSCDRRGSFSSLEDTSKFRFKSDDVTFANKNLFKSLSSKPLFVSKSETPSYIKDSPRMLRHKFSHQSSPEHTRSPKSNPFHQLGYNSVAYDPTSDCLTLTKANHSAIQQDIIGIKTMLLTLKRVLNESETRNSLNNDTQVCQYENDNIQNNNNNEFKVELTDLRRQVIFLQGQLEDKEKTVDNLQKQIDCLANQNTQIISDTPLLPVDIRNRCNAATQTDRIRPISSGSLTLSGSSMDDSGSLVRPNLTLSSNFINTYETGLDLVIVERLASDTLKITYAIENITEYISASNATIKVQKWDPKKFLEKTGRKIIAGMFHCPPFVEVEGDEISGTEFGLFKEFTKDWPIEYRVLKNTNKNARENLYSKIHRHLTLKKIDIGICNLWLKTVVEKGHDYSTSMYSDCLTFLVHKPTLLPAALFLFHPFQVSTWMLIILTGLLIASIYKFTMQNDFMKTLLGRECDAVEYFQSFQRIFLITVVTFGFFTATYHSAGMAVLLNFPRFSQEYVKDLGDMVKYNIKWEEPDSDISVWLKNTNQTTSIAIANNWNANTDLAQMNQHLRTGKYAMHVSLTSTGTIDGADEIVENQRTYLRLVPECLGMFYTATAFPKNSPVTFYFKERFILYFENGIMGYWVANIERKKKYRWMKNLKSLYADQRIHRNIDLQKLKGVIYFLLLGHLCGFLCFVSEILSLRYPIIGNLFRE